MKTRIGEVYRETRHFLIPYFVLLLAGIILRLIYTRNEIFFYLNDWHSLAADRLFRILTQIGYWPFTLTLVLLTLCFSYRKGLLITLTTSAGWLVGQLLKMFFGLPRPDVFYKNYVDKNGITPKIYYVPEVTLAVNPSFPSGHTITAFTLGLLFAYFIPKKALSPVFLLMALLVAYSRIYLKQHFFEDTVAGSMIGVIVTFFILVWLDAKPFFAGKNQV